jgi:hypothetical protein
VSVKEMAREERREVDAGWEVVVYAMLRSKAQSTGRGCGQIL